MNVFDDDVLSWTWLLFFVYCPSSWAPCRIGVWPRLRLYSAEICAISSALKCDSSVSWYSVLKQSANLRGTWIRSNVSIISLSWAMWRTAKTEAVYNTRNQTLLQPLLYPVVWSLPASPPIISSTLVDPKETICSYNWVEKSERNMGFFTQVCLRVF
jgi:hypothetical protein